MFPLHPYSRMYAISSVFIPKPDVEDSVYVKIQGVATDSLYEAHFHLCLNPTCKTLSRLKPLRTHLSKIFMSTISRLYVFEPPVKLTLNSPCYVAFRIKHNKVVKHIHFSTNHT